MSLSHDEMTSRGWRSPTVSYEVFHREIQGQNAGSFAETLTSVKLQATALVYGKENVKLFGFRRR
jgi:hypothetical protein